MIAFLIDRLNFAVLCFIVIRPPKRLVTPTIIPILIKVSSLQAKLIERLAKLHLVTEFLRTLEHLTDETNKFL